MATSPKLRKYRLDNMLCVRCGGPRLRVDKQICEVCQKRGNEAQIKMRDKRRAAGLCWGCGKRPPVDDPKFTRCRECRIKQEHYMGNFEPRRKVKAKERKRRVFEAYGGIECACPGCVENNLDLLNIDHINNDGGAHRKKIGGNIYSWLEQNNYPEGFRVLCFSCNIGRAQHGGICPHLIPVAA